jgi:hypothetical protein
MLLVLDTKQTRILITIYNGQRYHVLQWGRGLARSGEQELVNHLHSSLHNVVECTFGVWKMK